MAGEISPFERDVRDTVLKSGVTGVAASIIAITAFSPAGFGDWIGASVASSFNLDSTASAEDNAYANLPAYPAPMTASEISEIQSQLAAGNASMALLRAATDGNIEQMRAISSGNSLTVVARAAPVITSQSDLRLALSEPVSYAMSQDEAPVEAFVVETAILQNASYSAAAPANVSAASTPDDEETYSSAAAPGGGYDASAPYRDPHLELADLLLAHEQF